MWIHRLWVSLGVGKIMHYGDKEKGDPHQTANAHQPSPHTSGVRWGSYASSLLPTPADLRPACFRWRCCWRFRRLDQIGRRFRSTKMPPVLLGVPPPLAAEWCGVAAKKIMGGGGRGVHIVNQLLPPPIFSLFFPSLARAPFRQLRWRNLHPNPRALCARNPHLNPHTLRWRNPHLNFLIS